MTRPLVYMAGAVDKLPDLGVGWRREVAAELEAAGCDPVWPSAMLSMRARGLYDDDEAKQRWSARTRNWLTCPHRMDDPPLYSEGLKRLHQCDAVFVRWCKDVGPGTRAEIAYSVAIGLPTMVCLDGCGPDAVHCWSLFRDGLRLLGRRAVAISTTASKAIESVAERAALCVAERERLRQEAGA